MSVSKCLWEGVRMRTRIPTCCICPCVHVSVLVHIGPISLSAFGRSSWINPFWLIALISLMDLLKAASVFSAPTRLSVWEEWNVSTSASCGGKSGNTYKAVFHALDYLHIQTSGLIVSKHIQDVTYVCAPTPALSLSHTHTHTYTQLTIPTSFRSSRAHTV